MDVERWERRTEIPLLVLALAFLVGYAWPILDPDLDRTLERVLIGFSGLVWLLFAVDFAVRVRLAERRRRYVVEHWYDAALVVLPFLRPLRLLRLLVLVRVLNRTAAGTLAGRVGTYVGGAAILSIGLGALAMLDVERGSQDANITTFGDALWWATTTVTTVGYGDHYPVTTAGRFVAIALMVMGIAVVGVVTASVAAWLIHNVEVDDQRSPLMSSSPSSTTSSSVTDSGSGLPRSSSNL
ncbi:potassium channel family protein [Nocardioides donggukensis]|uniref:Two pore domain potassium channel family protein n=1 Tax=Nocardioides donggukensis TaxID=2774019 RepID=A0A927PZZ5_9ACTN|nr:potassium channel family protein [Nocardioides donggukensis]MBD8869955.1 two pore domain potassium channel family protein [Nocardioides donggukensis]